MDHPKAEVRGHLSDTRWSRSREQGPLSAEAAEALVSQYCADFVDGGLQRVLAHPVRSVRVWSMVGRLPVLRHPPLEGAEGAVLREILDRSSVPPLRRLLQLRSLLVLPDPRVEDPTDWGGRTLWKKVRGAARRGIRVEPVLSQDERRDLLAVMISREQTHSNPAYRVARPDLEHLLDHRTWLVARSEEDEALAVAVAVHSSEWGLLAYMRSLREDEAASIARYLLTERVVATLQAKGVRYLVDTASPFRLPNGLRHFQRMLGWRLHRVKRTR